METHDQDELQMARELQQALLPHHYPVVPAGARPSQSAVRFAHYFEPNGLVGGDLFDIVALGQSQVGVFICDVTGHGIRAALGTGIILGMLQQLCEETRNPARVLTRLNHRLSEILAYLPDGIYTSAFFMVLDVTDGSMTYANAGHPAPLLLRRAGEVEWLQPPRKMGPALALIPDTFYRNGHARLGEGDRILLYTDGITEVRDRYDLDYGEQALLDFATNNHHRPAEEFMQSLITELRAYARCDTFPDDACMVMTELHHFAV